MSVRELLQRTRVAAAGALVCALTALSMWLHAQLSDTRPLASLLPPGALLFLEAKDFHALLTEWNSSAEKRKWLASNNYEVLSRSRLVQRLSQAQDEFAAVAGTSIGFELVDQVAGDRSAFAFYNLSALKFVYLTHLTQGAIESTDLWRDRTHYQARDVGGIPFYVKSDSAGQRSIAFSSYRGWFVLATDENLMAETLVLLSGKKGASLATEQWFLEASQQSQAPGDLRLVYNLTALLPGPQFRTYWVQRNATELKPFAAGISDLFDRANAFEERRVILRRVEAPAAAGDPSLADVLSYAPETSSLYRAWSMPDPKLISDSLQQVLFGKRSALVMFNQPAPMVTPEAAPAGSEADLETRIDEPPFRRTSELSVTPLVNAIVAMQPTALLHVQMAAALRDQVFVMPNSGVVLVCKQPDPDALNRAIAQVSGVAQTGSLDPLHVSITGNIIVLTRIELRRRSSPALTVSGAAYAAVYDHAADWPNYKHLFAILDRTAANPEMPVSPETPAFFSGDLQSIGDTLSRLRRASIVSTDTGAALHEIVRYELAQP